MLAIFPDPLQKLLDQEFRIQRGALMGLFLVWLAGLWVLVLFSHPGWLLALGLAYVVMVAPARAGVDVIDGTEEFSFSLPPGRGPLYIARALPGVAFLLASGVAGGLSIALDLPQHVWSLVFSGGLTEPFAPVDGRFWWYALGVLAPLTAHAITFLVAANATSRGLVNAAWFLGALATLVLSGLVAMLEGALWREPNGLLATPVLLSVAIMVHLTGYRAYLGKEATRSGGQGSSNKGWSLAAVLLVAVVLILLMTVPFLMMDATRIEAREEAELRSERAADNAVTRTVETEVPAESAEDNLEPEKTEAPDTSPKTEQP